MVFAVGCASVRSSGAVSAPSGPLSTILSLRLAACLPCRQRQEERRHRRPSDRSSASSRTVGWLGPHRHGEALLHGKMITDFTALASPAAFQGQQRIPGWIEALDHAQRRSLAGDLPSSFMARGAGDGMIPPNQTLVFDLLDTTPAPRKGDPPYPRSHDRTTPATVRCGVLPAGRGAQRPARTPSLQDGGCQRAVLGQPHYTVGRGRAGTGLAYNPSRVFPAAAAPSLRMTDRDLPSSRSPAIPHHTVEGGWRRS